MGIRYTPILYLGRTFESEEGALAFYQKYFKLSEDQLEDIELEGFEITRTSNLHSLG